MIDLNMKNDERDNLRFANVIAILDEAVGGPDVDIGVHGAFWRNVSCREFVALEVLGLPLINRDSPIESNLLKAITGRAPFDGSEYPQMPAWLDPIDAQKAAAIEAWIVNGCPE
jgi:hypothetical protein